MKCLWRNKRTFYYRLWEGMEETVDEDGNIIETNVPIYSEPVMMKANITEEAGEKFVESATTEMFGISVDYDRIIVTDDMSCPISETSVLYIETDPINGAYDYRVTRVSKSLNSISIAIRRVEVT